MHDNDPAGSAANCCFRKSATLHVEGVGARWVVIFFFYFFIIIDIYFYFYLIYIAKFHDLKNVFKVKTLWWLYELGFVVGHPKILNAIWLLNDLPDLKWRLKTKRERERVLYSLLCSFPPLSCNPCRQSSVEFWVARIIFEQQFSSVSDCKATCINGGYSIFLSVIVWHHSVFISV